MLDEQRLVSRIINAYKHSFEAFCGHGDSIWLGINERNNDVHQAALRSDAGVMSEFLRNPHLTDLFYGFDFLAKSLPLPKTESEKAKHQRSLYKMLLDLCEVTGSIKAVLTPRPPTDEPSAEALLDALDNTLGFKVDFPNPFPFEPGLPTSRGIVSSRALAALHQTWRIINLTKGIDRPKVLEIGAGMGRIAYYSYKAGIRDFTIVDLPMTNVAQANFLGRVLPQEVISAEGEDQDRPIKINSTNWSPAPDDHFDIAINVDSLTEMDRVHAERYISIVKKCADIFMSINKETNRFSVKDVFNVDGELVIRNRYCLRPGYIEEIFFSVPLKNCR